MLILRKELPLLVALFMTFCSFASTNENTTNTTNAEIADRLPSGMYDILDVEINKNVKRYIDDYTKRGKNSTMKILGNSSIYFPIFEEYLAKHNLPSELKYLAVIESRLNPNAESHVGAVGLWQLMPATARELGLEINDYVDERKDVYRSTEAALKHLKKAYKRFGDWNLAIAAYNCGAGRVSKLLRSSEDKTIAGIRSKLPKETQHYLERFIAASYVMKNYQFHNLRPNYPDYMMQYTTVHNVKKRCSFDVIAKVTGIEKSVLERLNPALTKGIIPPSYKGYDLILPSIAIENDWIE